MPEFGDFLGFVEKLRLGVPQRTPRELAQFLAEIARTHYVETDIALLQQVLSQVILEIHGPVGLEEFLQEFRKRR